MDILFIIMIITWAVLAFVPTWLDLASSSKEADSSENISGSLPFIVPTFRDNSMSLEGPATASVYQEQSLIDEYTIVAKRKPRIPLHHISVEPGGESSADGPKELTIFDRDYILRSGARFVGNISVNGTVRIESDAIFTGNITSSKSVVVSQSAVIMGSIDCKYDIRIESNARVSGSLTTDGDIWIYENSRVGTGSHPVTVRAGEVIIAPTSRIHGSIWARRNGVRFPQKQVA